MKRFISLFVITILLLSFCFPDIASAAESPSLQVTAPPQVVRGESWEVTFSLRGNPEQKLSAFRLLVQYDSSYLTLKRMVTHESIPSGDFRYSVKTDSATGILMLLPNRESLGMESVLLSFFLSMKRLHLAPPKLPCPWIRWWAKIPTPFLAHSNPPSLWQSPPYKIHKRLSADCFPHPGF